MSCWKQKLDTFPIDYANDQQPAGKQRNKITVSAQTEIEKKPLPTGGFQLDAFSVFASAATGEEVGTVTVLEFPACFMAASFTGP